MTYYCAIFSHDFTLGGDGGDGPVGVSLVATTTVHAKSPRLAAAKGYVRCVGRRRARLLLDVLQAPAVLARHETDWRATAPLPRRPTRPAARRLAPSRHPLVTPGPPPPTPPPPPPPPSPRPRPSRLPSLLNPPPN